MEEARGNPRALDQFLTRKVAIVVFDQVNLFTLSALQEVFALANRFCENEDDRYAIHVCSELGGIVHTREGLEVGTQKMVDVLSDNVDTMVVSGGWGYEAARKNRALIATLRDASSHARRIAVLGGGVIVAAEAGLLDGRKASIHPAALEEIESRFITIEIDTASLYAKDGNVWTSPGMAATVDLALALVEEDMGYETTINIARFLVVYMRRIGTQGQVSLMLDLQSRSSRFFQLNQWISNNLNQALSIGTLAKQAKMSRRTFSRLYGREMGASPAKIVAQLRVEAALAALKESDSNVANIAYRCGFVNEERMRRAFLTHLGKPPSAFRRH